MNRSLAIASMLAGFYFATFEAWAEPWQVSKTERVFKNGRSAEECQRDARNKAIEGALVKALINTGNGKLVPDEKLSILSKNTKVIRYVKTRKSTVFDNSCKVAVRVTIETTALEEAALELSRKAIARRTDAFTETVVFIRFFINGKPASEYPGFSTQDATQQLASGLATISIKTREIRDLIEKYNLSKVSVGWTLIEQQIGWRKVDNATSDARTLDLVRLWNEGPERGRLDIITLGEVYITSRGQDGQSHDFLTEVKTRVKLVNVKTGGDLAVPSLQTTMVSGQTPSLAIANAVKYSVNSAIKEISGQIRQWLSQQNTYVLTFTNIHSERKQMRPIISVLSKYGLAISGNAGIDRKRNALELVVKFNGNMESFSKSLYGALDALESVVPVDDTETSGRRIKIILTRIKSQS